jgi:nitroreductase
MQSIDLSPDELLTTTRSVRRRLDLASPVEPHLLRECIEIALQAPMATALQSRVHFIVVTDPAQREALATLFRRAMEQMAGARRKLMDGLTAEGAISPDTLKRAFQSSDHLTDHLHEVPVHVIPCFSGRAEGLSVPEQSAIWGSIFPAVWSFLLAARARGLGGVITSTHLAFEREAADLLGIPYEQVMQVALIPLARTLGTSFKPGPRPPLAPAVHWDRW